MLVIGVALFLPATALGQAWPVPSHAAPDWSLSSLRLSDQTNDWAHSSSAVSSESLLADSNHDAENVLPVGVGTSHQVATAGSAPSGHHWQVMPQGLIYTSYLAGEKESRIRGVVNYERDNGWIWDITLGGRAGILRYGTAGDRQPEGFQVDIEGAGAPRLDLAEDRDVDAADFRFGVPITWGTQHHQVKLAYYHLSSHLGDEFLLKNPGFNRLNYSRDEIVLGYSYRPVAPLRLYAEAGWAFFADVAEPWEFQFGFDFAPAGATGIDGAPFVAANGHLREEVDFGGNFVIQAGWAWRRSPTSGIFRAGVQYFNGKSEQFSFFDDYESKFGAGLWYDF